MPSDRDMTTDELRKGSLDAAARLWRSCLTGLFKGSGISTPSADISAQVVKTWAKIIEQSIYTAFVEAEKGGPDAE